MANDNQESMEIEQTVANESKVPARHGPLSRRAFVKAGAIGSGVLLLGVYSKPSLLSVNPQPAYAAGTPTPTPEIGKGSIEFTVDDIDFYPGSDPNPTVTAELCNVSDHLPVTITSWLFTKVSVEDVGGHLVDGINSVHIPILDHPPTFPALTHPPTGVSDCADFPVEFHLNGPITTGHVKVKITAQIVSPSSPDALAKLTITLLPP